MSAAEVIWGAVLVWFSRFVTATSLLTLDCGAPQKIRCGRTRRTAERVLRPRAADLGPGPPKILFLDACRDNPLARNLARSMGMRSGNIGHGLAQVNDRRMADATLRSMRRVRRRSSRHSIAGRRRWPRRHSSPRGRPSADAAALATRHSSSMRSQGFHPGCGSGARGAGTCTNRPTTSGNTPRANAWSSPKRWFERRARARTLCIQAYTIRQRSQKRCAPDPSISSAR